MARRYKQECGGRLQWIAQLVINEKDQTSDLEKAVEAGAVAAHVRGLEGDQFFKAGRMDVIAKALENIRRPGLSPGWRRTRSTRSSRRSASASMPTTT